MAGVLVLAAGVPAAFERRELHRRSSSATSSCGSALVGQWLRAASRASGRPRDGLALRGRHRRRAGAAGWLRLPRRPHARPCWRSSCSRVVLELRGAALGRAHRHDDAGIRTTSPSGTGCSRSSCSASRVLARRRRACRARCAAARLLGARWSWIASAGLVLLFALWWLYFLRAGRRRARAQRAAGRSSGATATTSSSPRSPPSAPGSRWRSRRARRTPTGTRRGRSTPSRSRWRCSC